MEEEFASSEYGLKTPSDGRLWTVVVDNLTPKQPGFISA